MLLSWVAGIVVGILLGLLVPSVLRSKRPLWLSAIIGLVGALLGRLAFSSLPIVHPRFVGAIIGGLIFTLIWAAVTRGAPSK